MKWQTKKLDEICGFKKVRNDRNDLPYVGMEDIESDTGKFLGSLAPRAVKSSTFYFTNRDVLYGRLRPYLNKVLLPDFDGHCSTEIFPIRVGSELMREFLFYWLTSEDVVEKIDATCTGSRMPRADMNEVLDFEIPAPPLPEQKRIVKILDEVFAGIKIATENTEKNLQNAKELFESYVDTLLASPHDDWIESAMGDICAIKTGKKDVNEGNPSGKFPFFTCAREHTFSDTYSFDTEALLIAGNGDVGHVNYYKGKFEAYQRTYVLSDFKKVSCRYLFYLLDGRLKKVVSRQKLGNTMPYIKMGMLTDYLVKFPESVDEQNRHLRIFENLSAETSKLEAIYKQKLADLEELKKSVLKKAFAGEL